MWYYAHSVSLCVEGNEQYDLTQQLQMLSVTCPGLERLEYVQKQIDYTSMEFDWQVSTMRQGVILIWSSSYQDLIISNMTDSCDTLFTMELVRCALTKYGPLYAPI
jgi:hypothetical protein